MTEAVLPARSWANRRIEVVPAGTPPAPDGRVDFRVLVDGEWELEGPYTACEAYARERARTIARKRSWEEREGREVTT